MLFPWMPYFLTFITICFLTYAIFTDVRNFTIPNFVSLAIILFFVPWAFTVDFSLDAVASRFLVAAAVLAIGFFLFMLRVLGGGDVKLIAAVSLWIGPENILQFFFLIALIGGVLGLVLILFRRMTLPQGLRQYSWVEKQYSNTTEVPYALAISPAAIYILLNGIDFSSV